MDTTRVYPGWGITVVRVVMGVILLVAGYAKFAGGIGGFQGFLGNLGIPLPELFAVVIPTLELVGGILVLLGLFVRWVGILLMIEFLVTTFYVKLPRPAPLGGFDSARIDMMLLAGAVMLILAGAGKLALDEWLARRRAPLTSRTQARTA